MYMSHVHEHVVAYAIFTRPAKLHVHVHLIQALSVYIEQCEPCLSIEHCELWFESQLSSVTDINLWR